MSFLRRRAAVGVAAGALLAGVAVFGSTLGTAHAAGSTLREAAADQGRFAGVAVNDSLLGNAQYADLVAREFSSVTAENVMKWETIEPSQGQFNWSGGDRLVNFAQQNNQKVYGHTLVWHSQMPGWLENGNFSASQLRQ
ncbi:endo-1,4-beta-xylanase, partial [Streptomyces sp. YIM 98790]|uniref:endo-1,4-beta-xylanase n=1 Tax=Streptomyces sp. YIM 98790 TaxID=2689077 RepID=UPI001A9FB5B1